MDLTVQGKRVFVYTGGRAFDVTLPAVVFIHGGEHDHSVWALQSRYFAHHGRAVLVPDLPGHGRSDGPALASIEAMAEWIIGLLDTAGIASATLVGHSMGSLVALEAAARAPERVTKLALLGTAFPMRVSPELLDTTRADEPRAHAMINTWSHSAQAHYPGNPGPGTWVPGANLRLLGRQPAGTLFADFNACNAYRGGAEAAAKVRCPTLLLVAQRDLMTSPKSARELAKTMSGARVIEIAASGHAMMAEQPDAVLDALLTL